MGNQISIKRNKVIEKKRSFSSSTKNSFTQRSRQDFILDIYPSTPSETSRQRGEHYLLKYIFQTSYFAPVEDILTKPESKTLDIGCGQHADWLIDIASDFSESTFYGFDIVDVFGSTTNKIHIPTNCIIIKQDLFNGFPYKDNTFDYVHQRMMHLIYHSEKLPWMFQEILRVTKENGWIELVEPDVIPKAIGPLFSKIFDGVHSFQRDLLGEVLEGKLLVKKMSEAGIVDIKSDYCSVPVCWGGYIGKLVYENLLATFNQLGPILFDYLDLGSSYDKKQLDEYLDQAFNECVEYRTYFNVQWACGRKPTTAN